MKKIKIKVTQVFKNFELYVYIFIIIILLFIYLYIRFLKPRFPKDIPYPLTEFYFYILLSICISYIYIIYRQLNPKNPPQIILDILNVIRYPFEFLKSKIIYHQNIYPKYTKILYEYLLFNADNLYVKTADILYFFIKFFPKISLLLIFILDTFIFQKIQIFYYFLLLNLIPLCYHYFIINLRHNKEILILHLEAKYKLVFLKEENNDIFNYIWEDIIDNFGKEKFEKLTFEEKVKILVYEEKTIYDDIYDDKDNLDDIYPRKKITKHNPNAIFHRKEVTIKEYIDIMYERMRNGWDDTDIKNSYNYTVSPICHPHIYREFEKIHNVNELTMEHYEELDKEFFFIKEILYKLISFLDTHKYLENKYKKLNICLDTLTLLCWIFILTISIHVFPPNFEITLNILENILYHLINQDPFSFNNIFLYFNNTITFWKIKKECQQELNRRKQMHNKELEEAKNCKIRRNTPSDYKQITDDMRKLQQEEKQDKEIKEKQNKQFNNEQMKNQYGKNKK